MNFAPMVMNPTPESLKSLAEYSRDHLLNYVKSFIDFKGEREIHFNWPIVIHLKCFTL